MKAAFPGETLLAEAWTSHIGRRLAFLTVDIRNKDTGVLLAQGKHTKYMSVATTQNPSDEGKSWLAGHTDLMWVTAEVNHTFSVVVAIRLGFWTMLIHHVKKEKN